MYIRFLRFLLVACWTHKFNVLINISNVYDRLIRLIYMMKMTWPESVIILFFSPLLIILILFIYLLIYCLWIWLRSSRRICPVQFATREFVFVEDHGDDRSIERIQWNYCLWLPVIIQPFSRTTKNTYCDISGLIFLYEIQLSIKLLTDRRVWNECDFSHLGENSGKFKIMFSNWSYCISRTKKIIQDCVLRAHPRGISVLI